MTGVYRVCTRFVRHPRRRKHTFVILVGVIVAVYVILATGVISDDRDFKHSSRFVFNMNEPESSQNSTVSDLQFHHQPPPASSSSSSSSSSENRTSDRYHHPHLPHHPHLSHPSPHNDSDRINGAKFPGRSSVFLGFGNETSSSLDSINGTMKSADRKVSDSRMTDVDTRSPGGTIGETERSKGNDSHLSSGPKPLRPESGEKGDNAERNLEGESITTSPPSILLAGVPRSRKVFLTVGMVTVKREKADYFMGTMTSLLQHSSANEQREMSIIVLLGDRTQAHNDHVLRQIQERFPRQLESGLLLVLRGPNTDFIFNNTSVKRTFSDSLNRVQWRSKQNIDYAAVMDFCANLSTYYLHLEDDVIAAVNYLRHIRDFIKANEKKVWAMIEVCPHGFIGKLFKNEDLPKLVMILRSFYLEQPCDFLINYFIQMMTQTKRIVRSGNLFFHQGKISSLTNQTRKTDKVGEQPKVNSKVDKTPGKKANPAADVISNLTIYQTHGDVNAYDLQTSDFMWASDVQEGQRLTVVFTTIQTLKRLTIDTGFSSQNLKDILQKGMVEMGTKPPSPSSPLLCPDAKKVGQFQNGHFDVTLKPPHDIGCISVVITDKQDDWLIIRNIVVTTA